MACYLLEYTESWESDYYPVIADNEQEAFDLLREYLKSEYEITQEEIDSHMSHVTVDKVLDKKGVVKTIYC